MLTCESNIVNNLEFLKALINEFSQAPLNKNLKSGDFKEVKILKIEKKRVEQFAEQTFQNMEKEVIRPLSIKL